jgi:hypothetical protein
MVRHNKKRNTGLLYEFLVQTISDAILEENDEKRKVTHTIVKKAFSKNTELFKEFRLFHSLFAHTVQSESVADSILEAAKQASKRYDRKKLDHEKSILIRNINHRINDKKFYDKRINEGEYRIYATIQTLLNEWRSDEVGDIVRVAQYEQILKEWLLTEKRVTALDEEAIKSSDPLVEKLMTKKLNEKYKNNLTVEQANLVKSYVFENSNELVVGQLKTIKENTLNEINSYLEAESGKNSYLDNKLTRAKELILSESVEDTIDDEKIEKFLDIAKLKYELRNNE